MRRQYHAKMCAHESGWHTNHPRLDEQLATESLHHQSIGSLQPGGSLHKTQPDAFNQKYQLANLPHFLLVHHSQHTNIGDLADFLHDKQP